MGKRESSMGSRYRLSRFLSQAPITGNDESIATFHETARENVVKQILLHVFFLSKYGLVTGPLTTGPAKNQYIGATGVNHAAHCVPCQILFGTTTLQKLITTDDELELELENLFADTHAIHQKFNKADKSAEDSGLTTAFGNACNLAANFGRTVRFGRAEDFLPYVENAYAAYKQQAIAAFSRSILNQQTEMRAGKELTGTTRREVISILETYRSTARSSIDSLDTVQGLFPEDIWQAYRALV